MSFLLPFGLFKQLPESLHQSHLGWRISTYLGIDKHRLIEDDPIVLLFRSSVAVRRHEDMRSVDSEGVQLDDEFADLGSFTFVLIVSVCYLVLLGIH